MSTQYFFFQPRMQICKLNDSELRPASQLDWPLTQEMRTCVSQLHELPLETDASVAML